MSQNKPLLELKNIGKIYVSEGNVAVGIRGVNLAFNRGEFVAVTGMSGSGKSTLLNVISGMDSYEEGELLIEGEPTSHYLQKDWEEYRKEYISFIFQDYNILESFTVLQNVELALMNIDDPTARRQKALELLRRVGLERHLHHKGSKLSGGQKQRTVIARALAKDSPIILADEPTGNLDSQSSKEIIELLREISREKLVIIVTHNFEEVEHCATRHVRIYDGAVELDRTVRTTEPMPSPNVPMTPIAPPPGRARQKGITLRNGLHLGRVCFASMPKLSIFLCCLMTVTALVITLMTAFSYDATALFDDPLMFTHIEGRLVLARRDGAVITDEELEKLAADLGAEDAMHYDFMLDRTTHVSFDIGDVTRGYRFSFGYPATDTHLDAGRYPEANDEIVLDVPISLKPYFGDKDFKETDLPFLFDMITYRVVGIRYYYDNTQTPRMLFTEEGYKIASAIAFYAEQSHNFTYQVTITDPISGYSNVGGRSANTIVDPSMPAGSYYPNLQIDGFVDMNGNKLDPTNLDVSVALFGHFGYTDTYNGYYRELEYEGVIIGENKVHYTLDRYSSATPSSKMITDLENRYFTQWQNDTGISTAEFVVISPDILLDFMYEHYYQEAYTQASLFFKSDREARRQVEPLRERGYVAVVSDETIVPDVFTMLTTKLAYVIDAVGWVLSVVFATFFLSLCTSRAMNAVRGDVAIMRSMGIPTSVVRVSMYVRTLLALIPALLVTAITCTVIYMLPSTNSMFHFLHTRDYVILAFVLVAIALNLSRKQAAKMFHESVKKTLKGGKKS